MFERFFARINGPFALLVLGLWLSPVVAHAAQVPSLGQMFANASSTWVSLIKLTLGISFVAGLFISGVGLFKLKAYADGNGRVPLSGPFIILFVGAVLVALPGFIDTTTETLSLGHYTGSVLAVSTGGGGSQQFSAAIKGVLLFVKLVGNIAFVRGFLILKDVGEQKGNATIGRALTHIIGGAMAINIGPTIAMLGATFAPGMNLSV